MSPCPQVHQQPTRRKPTLPAPPGRQPRIPPQHLGTQAQQPRRLRPSSSTHQPPASQGPPVHRQISHGPTQVIQQPRAKSLKQNIQASYSKTPIHTFKEQFPPHSAVNPPRSPSLPEKPSSTNQQHPSGDHSPAPRQPLKTNRAVRGPPYMGGSKTGKPPSGDFFIPSSHGASAPVARGENLPGQPRHAAERCASAAGRSVISSPSGPAVTSTRLPSSTVPSSNMPASRSCRFRWMTRRSGRAP